MAEKHATRVPTVLIGIGGIGGGIVRLVNEELRDYDKQFVQILVLDTNTNDLSKSSKINIPYIQTSENKTVSDYLRQNKRFQAWFPMNPLINAKNLTQGAGQIRSVSRLGALASEDAHRFDTIRQAIEKVNRNVGNTMHNMVRVMIVGSVCGGTGSGMGIQLPFLVRDLIEEIAHMPRTIIRGLFIMPDIVEEVQDTDEKKKSVYVNGYSFLRELNAFNMAQTYQQGTDKLKIEHYRRDETSLRDDPTQMSHQTPYDFLFLIEKNNVDGQNIGGFDAYISKAAQIVKAQLFASDMTADLHSSEDNLIVSAVNKEGMNRYCGAGISRAIYPEEENRRYCVLRYSESILQGYWLRIDRMVAVNMAQHKRLMASNPSLMPKDPQEEYIKIFDELTDPTKTEVTMEMGYLKRELAYEATVTNEAGKEETRTVNYADDLFQSIMGYVGDLYESDELIDAGKECQMNKKDLNSDHAAAYCSNKLQGLRNYEKKAKEHIGKLTAGAIDAIIGSDAQISKTYSDAVKYPYNICAVVKDKHPIVARYILYYVRRMLMDCIIRGDAEIAALNEEESIFKKDYYKDKTKGGKDTVKEDPAEALSITKPGLLSVFGLKSPEYKRLVDTIERDAKRFVKRTDEHYSLKLQKEVFSTVIKRVDILISIYEAFFNELESIMVKNTKEREILEQDQSRIQGADIYVCMDKLCKDWLYKKFEHSTTGADITLPDDVKISFFDTIFKEYINKHKLAEDSTAFTDDPISMSKLFQTAILDPLTEKYKDKEMAHIHMDIISALNLEYKIHSQNKVLRVNGELVDPTDFEFDQYFESVAVQLRNLSSPYLTYSTLSEDINNLLIPNADVEDVSMGDGDGTAAVLPPTNGRVLCYWGINDSAVALHQHKGEDESIDRDGLTRMFGPANGAVYFVVNDDSFDPKELVCYSSVYDLMIENLDKYNSSSKAYKEYTARILRVIKSDYNVGTGASAYLDTVHPHLDRHWHAHAYLPMLRIDDEIAERKRIAKAFLLSIACKRVWYMQLDHTPCWTFRKSGKQLPSPLTIGGEQAVRPSFYTLYGVMDENTVTVNDILKTASSDEKKLYNEVRSGGIRSEDILKHPVIAGLIGRDYTEDELNDLENIFSNLYDSQTDGADALPVNILRVIYCVYKDSYDRKLTEWLIDNLTEFISSYCLTMVNGQKGAAGILFEDIVKAIGRNFNAKDADLEFRMLCDKFL